MSMGIHFTEGKVQPYRGEPQNLGEGVWYFGVSLGKDLVDFKKDHPEFVVTAIVPDIFFVTHCDMILGYLVNCEKNIEHRN